VLTLTPGIWDATLDQLRCCGNGQAECVAYWTASIHTPERIDAVVHPVHTASAGHYDLDSRWLHRFWVDLGEAERTTRLQAHTHIGPAFHSSTDDTFPLVHTPGFLSLVVPGGGKGSMHDDELWLAEIDDRGRWRRVAIRDRIARA
jgi:hypothetical protein